MEAQFPEIPPPQSHVSILNFAFAPLVSLLFPYIFIYSIKHPITKRRNTQAAAVALAAGEGKDKEKDKVPLGT